MTTHDDKDMEKREDIYFLWECRLMVTILVSAEFPQESATQIYLEDSILL